MYLQLLGFVIWSFPNGSLYLKLRRTLLDCWASRNGIMLTLTSYTSRSRISHKDDWLQLSLTSPMLHQRGVRTQMETQTMKRWFGYNYTQMNSNEERTLVHNTISENMEINKSYRKTSWTDTFVLVVEVAFGNIHMDWRISIPLLSPL